MNISIFILHLICIIIFYRKQINDIKEKIQKIIYGIKNWSLVKKEEKARKKELEKLRKQKEEKDRIERLKKEINIEMDENKKDYKKHKKLINKKGKKIEQTNHIKILNPIDYYYLSKNPNLVTNFKDSNPPKKKKERNIIIQNNVENLNIHNNKKRKKNKGSTENISNELENKKEIIKEVKEIMEFNDQELNEASYETALKYDKRTYFQYYCSLIKTKNIFIFSFFYNMDYNSKIVKIDLFFIGFIIYFTVNALFFNDNTMHKIYEDKGKFQILYQLPQIVYSSLISMVLNILLKLLALSESDILLLKGKKTKKDLDKREEDLYNKLQLKFLLYFVISSIFMLLFWYYLSMFCVIYKNTQLHLIKDTLISFSLSFFYPFGIYLLPGLFRIPSLINKKKKREYLYTMSKILQMI